MGVLASAEQRLTSVSSRPLSSLAYARHPGGEGGAGGGEGGAGRVIAQQNMKDWHGMFYADVYHTDEEWWARERNELARESELQPSCPNPTSTLLRPFASLTFSERDHIASPILRPRTPPLLPSIPAPSFQRRHHSHDDDFCILSLART